MSLTFSAIAPHLQLSIVRKLEFKDFSHFLQCSQHSLALSHLVQRRIPFEVSKIVARKNTFTLSGINNFPFSELHHIPVTFRVGTIHIADATEETYGNLLRFLKDSSSTAERVIVNNGDAVHVDNVIQLAKVKSGLFGPLNQHIREYFKLPGFKQLEFFSAPVPVYDDDLLAMTSAEISLQFADITENGLNSFLKDWLKGVRKIKKVEISALHEFDREHVVANLPCFRTNEPGKIILSRKNGDVLTVILEGSKIKAMGLQEEKENF